MLAWLEMQAAAYSRSEGENWRDLFLLRKHIMETLDTFFKEELLSVQSLHSPQFYVNSSCQARHDLVKMEKSLNKSKDWLRWADKIQSWEDCWG